MALTLRNLASMTVNKMRGGFSFEVAVSAVEKEELIPEKFGSPAELRIKLHRIVSKIHLKKYFDSLNQDQRAWLNWCTKRASEIMWEDKDLFANAPDAARKALDEMREQFQREGVPQASAEHIDLATRLICSRLGSRKKGRRVRKPEQKRLNLT